MEDVLNHREFFFRDGVSAGESFVRETAGAVIRLGLRAGLAALMICSPWFRAELIAQSSISAKPAAEMSDDELARAVAQSLGQPDIMPRERGFSASAITSSQHDSITGWANIFTPTVAYRFGRHLSVDASTPIFLYLRTASTTATSPPPARSAPPSTNTSTVAIRHGLIADTVLGVHYLVPHLKPPIVGSFYNVVSALLIAPTGSVSDGIGAGKVTFNVTNHLESSSRFSPYVDLGIGTNSRVQNRQLQRDQTSQGPLANFAAGGRARLPFQSMLTMEAYEQLPLGTESVSQTDPRPGGPPETQDAVVTSGTAEDNGFNTTFEIPLRRRVTFSVFYSRSLRQHEDIGGVSLMYLLKRASR